MITPKYLVIKFTFSSGDESNPYADSGFSYKASDNHEDNDEKSTDENNQLATTTVDPRATATKPVTINDTWGPCGHKRFSVYFTKWRFPLWE